MRPSRRIVCIIGLLQGFAISLPQVEECNIWLAPSTIPGAGLGIFAGIDFDEDDVLTTGDLVIPLTDMHWHNDVSGFDDTQDFLWDEYTWSARVFKEMEDEAAEVYGASFGIGAVPNCLFPVINADESYHRFDTAGLHRSRDPGAGAFTPYYDRVGTAREDVAAGREIFVNYGKSYFLSQERIDSIGIIPFKESFRNANKLLYRLDDLIEAVQSRRSRNELEDVDLIVFADLYHWMATNLSDIWASRTLKALPMLHYTSGEEFIDEFNELYDRGTGSVNEDRSVRSLEWLREHGSCMGNLEIRESTVAQAGRGAFARQPIPEGHVVTAVPLIHIPNRTIMNIYDIMSVKHEDSAVVHHQLLLNYCFGAENTTLLLCPYGSGSGAINHDSNPNARIVWNKQLSPRPNWLELPPDDWVFNYTSGLAFDYVATRDIAEGEEVFIDYGSSWVEAWNQHLATWEAKNDAYVTEEEMNNDIDGTIPTMYESNTLMKHVDLLCREEYLFMAGIDPFERDDHLHRCRVIHRSDENLYNVEIYTWIEKESTETCFIRVRYILFDVPRDAFFFKDVPYSRDHAQHWSFRHEMELPRHLLPEVWKNAVVNDCPDEDSVDSEGVGAGEL